MTAILKSHETNYVKMRCAYKRSTRSDSIGFLFGCDSSRCIVMANNEELAKTVESLTASVKSMQDQLTTLTSGATYSGVNSQSGSGLQYSGTDSDTGLTPPPKKKTRVDDDEDNSEEEMEDVDSQHGPLIPLSEAAAAFLEASFNKKLDNKSRVAKAKANGIPDSRWIRCAQLDPVVSANLPPTARTADRAASRIQNFWLDAANPLIFILEKAENLEVPAEVITGIQTSLQLMGNANYQHSMDSRHAVMMQLNPKLKQLINHTDLKDAAPYLFGEKFGAMAKERLEAAEVLRKTMPSDNSKRGFQKSHFQKTSRGGGNRYYSGTGGSRGWQGPGNKAKKGQPKK